MKTQKYSSIFLRYTLVKSSYQIGMLVKKKWLFLNFHTSPCFQAQKKSSFSGSSFCFNTVKLRKCLLRWVFFNFFKVNFFTRYLKEMMEQKARLWLTVLFKWWPKTSSKCTLSNTIWIGKLLNFCYMRKNWGPRLLNKPNLFLKQKKW